MGKIARGTALAAALALGAGCSSTSTNEAASGGASGTGGASSGGASGASTGGASTGGAGADAGSGGGTPSALVWCTKLTDCAALCDGLQPYCSPSGACTCVNPGCELGSTAECPVAMTCVGDACHPDGKLLQGEICDGWPSQRCSSGLICDWKTDGKSRCSRPCKLAAPPAGCTCLQDGAEQVWGWCQ